MLSLLSFNRNEDKFGKRQKNNGDAYGYEDGVTELFHTEAYAPDYWTMKDEEERRRKREELLDRLPELLATLNPRQQSRVRAYFYEERTARDIAAEEGVSHTAVLHSIQSALKKLKEMME